MVYYWNYSIFNYVRSFKVISVLTSKVHTPVCYMSPVKIARLRSREKMDWQQCKQQVSISCISVGILTLWRAVFRYRGGKIQESQEIHLSSTSPNPREIQKFGPTATLTFLDTSSVEPATASHDFSQISRCRHKCEVYFLPRYRGYFTIAKWHTI